ncbi:GalNAc(5)-diNAcBac-PP-undecaprenol beta-1,3-glucosyltransferase [Nymphon striatum]|nr:GalNAc(5)-diNAcBac-PP-undecaprenol beta-1,3-glucosyltransferase [Nymphon striatum]
MAQHKTALTVVIPSKDRPERLLNAVKSILPELTAPDRIIVVDDASSTPLEIGLRDGLTHEENAVLTVLRNETPQRPGGARNVGVQAASTPYIVFLDDDDALAQGYLAALRAYWQSADGADYGYSATTNTHGLTSDGTFEPLPVRPSRRHMFPLSLGVWVSRTAFLEVGGLRAELTTNEDTEFGVNLKRHGLTGVFFSGAGVIINPNPSNGSTEIQSEAPSITKSVNARHRAECFAQILTIHAPYLNTPDADAFRNFCMRRMLELSAKAKQPFDIPDAIARGLSCAQMLKWRLVFYANRVARSLADFSKGS